MTIVDGQGHVVTQGAFNHCMAALDEARGRSKQLSEDWDALASRMQTMRKAAQLYREASIQDHVVELPKGPFRCIVADPPWAYLWGTGKDGGNFSPEKHYATMTTDEICALPVRALRDKNAVLALWATGPCLPDAFRVMDAWGFKFKTMLFVWVKQNPKALTIVCGPGSYTRSACEYVLLGMRGHIKRASTDPISQVILAPRLGHSRKPEAVQDALERLFPDGPRLELFARRARPGWVTLGNEADGLDMKDSLILLAQGKHPCYGVEKHGESRHEQDV